MGAIVRDEKGHFKGNGSKTSKPKNNAVAAPEDLHALISKYVAQLFKQKYGTDIPKNAKIEIVNLGKELTKEQLAQKAAVLENQNSRLKSVLHDLDERHKNICQILRDETERANDYEKDAQRWYEKYQDIKKKSASRIYWFSWAAFTFGQVLLILITIVLRRNGISF